ncbi:MAG: hypothetical protein ACLPWF_32415 [Bryobacteraceae bacterium]
MNLLRALPLVFALGAASFGGTVQQLPALPNGAMAQALQVDAAGNIYVAGVMPPKSPQSSADTSDAFVAKISADGSKVLYFTVLGGSGEDAATALAVGSDDSVYVTGTTNSTNFPVTPGALQTVFGGELSNAFAAKLDANGAIVYATYVGEVSYTIGENIAIDGAGDAFLLGGGGIPPGVTGIVGPLNQGLAGWVIKIDPTGSKMLMGFAGLAGQYIAVDGGGNVYIAGVVTPPLGPTLTAPTFTPGAFQTSEPTGLCGGDFNAIPCPYEYVAKVDPTGTMIIYLTGLNGTYGATPAGIAVDASGNAIVAGTTYSPDFPVTADAFESLYAPVIPPPQPFVYPGPHYIPPPATGFAAKLNATGSGLVWSTFFGGSVSDSILSMGVDSEGGIVLAGMAGSSDLPGLAGVPAGCLPSAIQKLSFAARLTPDATSASPSQLFYGQSVYVYGPALNLTGPIAVASSAVGSIAALGNSGSITAADLFASSRLACLTDPADNFQISSVAPGQDLTLFGSVLAPAGGFNATIDGLAAPILYASDEQVNVQVPTQIAGGTNVQMKVTNQTTTPPLDETRTLAVVAQQPSVFLTDEALGGVTSPCYGPDGSAPGAVALNADGSLNSASNPAAAGSTVTIFLNGVAPGAAVTGSANDNPAKFTASSEAHEGALAVSFQIPQGNAQAPTPGVTLTALQAGGVAVRENVVAVCTH